MKGVQPSPLYEKPTETTSASITHTFASSGTSYTVSLTIFGANGESAATSRVI
ncbi:MAG TPA: hypothetical protein VKU89_07370 [Solirubrobacteraceae bacterium]|nr:hypothetical protein [Solirubrobacteraceae bacterium]